MNTHILKMQMRSKDHHKIPMASCKAVFDQTSSDDSFYFTFMSILVQILECSSWRIESKLPISVKCFQGQASESMEITCCGGLHSLKSVRSKTMKSKPVISGCHFHVNSVLVTHFTIAEIFIQSKYTWLWLTYVSTINCNKVHWFFYSNEKLNSKSSGL